MLIISIKLSKVKSQDNLTDFGQKRPWPLMSNMNSNECDLPSTVFTCWFPWLNLEKQKSKPAFVHESLPDYRQRIIIQPFSNERLLKKKNRLLISEHTPQLPAWKWPHCLDSFHNRLTATSYWNASSHAMTKVKQRWTWSLPCWMTAWKYQVDV